MGYRKVDFEISEEDKLYIAETKVDMQLSLKGEDGIFGDEDYAGRLKKVLALPDWELNFIILSSKYSKQALAEKLQVSYPTILKAFSTIKDKLNGNNRY